MLSNFTLLCVRLSITEHNQWDQWQTANKILTGLKRVKIQHKKVKFVIIETYNYLKENMQCAEVIDRIETDKALSSLVVERKI